MHDVIVVGAGPAGLYCALRLADEGLDVLVLEEHDTIGTPTHCTGIVSAELQELFKLPEQAVLQRPSRCVLVAPSGMSVEFGSPGEELAVLDRKLFDQALAASVESAGVTVLTGHRVERVTTGPTGVTATVGRDTVFGARALVLASGVSYRFHRMLGFSMPSALLHTAQVELDAASPSSSLEIHFGRQVAPQGFAWLVPVNRANRYRVKAGVLVRGDARAHLRRFLATAPVAERVATAPREPVRRLLPVAPVRRSYGPRVILVGDAAGLTKPVTGGGIFYGVLSGSLAAETLVEALAADDLGLRRLASYESRWRARLGRELWTGQWFRRVLAALTDPELEAFVKALGSDGARGAIAKTARFNWHRGMIVALLREPGIKSILLRSLFR